MQYPATCSNAQCPLLSSREVDMDDRGIHALHCQIWKLLAGCWQTTGFGRLIIESERIHGKGSKIAVTIRGPTHYRYVINEASVHKPQASKRH